MFEKKRYEIEWGGRPLIVETGRLANQANGSCLVTYGETVVLATAVMNKNRNENASWLPLMVDYEEKMYAAGRIKGSRFIKRETRPTDEAILTARLIDRGLRPLFDERIRHDIQVVTTVLAFDGENDPDIIAILGASIALHMSEIPWNGPIAPIRVGQINGEWVMNPTYEARSKSEIDLTACYYGENVINIEAGCKETPADTMYEAFAYAQKHARPILKLIEDIRKDIGREKISVLLEDAATDEEELDENQKMSLKEIEDLRVEAKKIAQAKIGGYLFNIPRGTKGERKEKVYELKDELIAWLAGKNIGKDRIKKILDFFDDFIEEEVSRAIIQEDRRVDGRKLNELRKITCEVGIMNRTHGSAIFNRGETQVLSVVTLGSPGDEQLLDGMELSGKKRYFHHYNFPPYSVGEARPMRGAGRREVGHGALAEKALLPVLPSKEDFPYTIRVVSETMGSNGSSSMASTCGSTLSLMDAGVPIKRPVAGIAIGLASDEKGNFKVLTDLQDLEDGQGGMDFKMTGTSEGLTAIQMDTKTLGLTMPIIRQALTQGTEALNELLGKMTAVIPTPREEMSKYAPRITTLRINPEKIRDVIGPGGKVINEIIAETGVSIDIEDDGLVMITSTSAESSAEAIKRVNDLTQEAKVGAIYEGTVVRILDFGAFVEIFPGQDGMVHISEILKDKRVEDINDVLKVGQKVKVKVIKIDEVGRVNLSMKQVD